MSASVRQRRPSCATIDRFLDLIAFHVTREAIRIGTLGAVVGVHGGAQLIGVSWIAAPWAIWVPLIDRVEDLHPEAAIIKY